MVGTSQRPALRFDDGGWAQAIGNHVALDLVNTVAWRLDAARTVDRLPDGAALVRWAQFVGLLDDHAAAAFARELTDDPAHRRPGRRQAYGVRGSSSTAWSSRSPSAPNPTGRTWARCTERLLGVLGRAEVVLAMPLDWSTGLRSVRRPRRTQLGLQVWRFLEREDPTRLRQCQDADCGWLFLDRTKNASRVWCSSADCGNRTRARRHYQRRGAESPG